MISFTLCGFVTGAIATEFHRGAKARGSSSKEPYFKALWSLTVRNRRRYGGYTVHFGVVLLFLGFTGNAFNREIETGLKHGESATSRKIPARLRRLFPDPEPAHHRDSDPTGRVSGRRTPGYDVARAARLLQTEGPAANDRSRRPIQLARRPLCPCMRARTLTAAPCSGSTSIPS